MPTTLDPTLNDPELAARAHLFAKARLIGVHPDKCSIHPGNRRDLDRAQPHIADLAEFIGKSGQLEAAVGRPSSDPERPIELLKGACRRAAVTVLNADGKPTELWVLVLDDCSDEQAWEIITNEQVRTKAWSSWETAEHFDALFEVYGSNKAIHRRLGLDPANIGRTRKVTALPQSLVDIIADKHEISARSAVTFMANWDVAKTRRRLEIAIAELGRAYPEKLAADDAFTAMTEALRDDRSSAPVVATKKTAIATAPMQQDSAPEGMIGDDLVEPQITNPASSALVGDVDAAAHVNSEQNSKDVEAILVHEAIADDRRTDIVGDDDSIVGHAIIHMGGGLTIRIDGPLADFDAVRAASKGVYRAMLKLHDMSPQTLA